MTDYNDVPPAWLLVTIVTPLSLMEPLYIVHGLITFLWCAAHPPLPEPDLRPKCCCRQERARCRPVNPPRSKLLLKIYVARSESGELSEDGHRPSNHIHNCIWPWTVKFYRWRVKPFSEFFRPRSADSYTPSFNVAGPWSWTLHSYERLNHAWSKCDISTTLLRKNYLAVRNTSSYKVWSRTVVEFS